MSLKLARGRVQVLDGRGLWSTYGSQRSLAPVATGTCVRTSAGISSVKLRQWHLGYAARSTIGWRRIHDQKGWVFSTECSIFGSVG